MLDPLKRFRREKGIESTEDIWVSELAKSMKKFEASGWVQSLIESLNEAAEFNPERSEEDILPENTIETWLRLDSETQTYVFLYLLGGIYGLMRPPEAPVAAVI